LFTHEVTFFVQGNVISNVYDAGVEPVGSAAPVVAVIQNNTINNAGFTGIGSYYVQGWKDSVLSGNTVSNSPSLFWLLFEDAKGVPVTMLTLTNNQFIGNTLINPVNLPPTSGDGIAPATLVSFAPRSGLPSTVTGNLIQGNRFGTSTPGPELLPPQGFIDGGGNICSPVVGLSCLRFLLESMAETHPQGRASARFSQNTAQGGERPSALRHRR
jgi:hypothetical protein